MNQIKFRQAIYNGLEFMRFHYWGIQDDEPQEYFLGFHGTPQQARIHSDMYIGVKDKNGKEIYARDIFNWHGMSLSISFCDKRLEWQVGGMALTEMDASYGKVIGNIHENPELMEAQNESD